MGAAGALAGWRNWLGIFLITAIFGGVVAIVITVLQGRLKKTLWNVGFIFSGMRHGRPAVIAVATIAGWAWSALFAR